MIDIHSHILFGVDDGPSQLEEAMNMLYKAVEEGIDEIIATSHACNPHFHVSAVCVKSKLMELQKEIIAQKIPLKLHAGHEVRLKENLVELLKKGEILTLANSKYLLLELPSQGIPSYTTHIIHELMSEGIIPIIAHPERNRAIAEKPSRLARLINHGALAQVTAGSLSGHFGKAVQRVALQLVDANLVHTYGSDVHNLDSRPFHFDAGLTYLEKQKRMEAVDIFLENNARIVENSEVIILEPEELEKPKWWKVFS